jgi:hypothetical protein
MESAPTKVRAVTLDKDQFDETLEQNGLGPLVNPKAGSDEFKTAINLRTNVRDQINAEQTRLGRELSRDEKQKIMDTTTMNTVSVPRFIGSNQVPAFELTPDQSKKAFVTVGTQKITLASIPAAVRAGIMQRRQARGLPNTELGIATDWVGAGMPGKASGKAPSLSTPSPSAPDAVYP